MRKCAGNSVTLALSAALLIHTLSGLAAAGQYDLIENAHIDRADLAAFVEQWLADSGSLDYCCHTADFNRSDTVDFDDFALLTKNWGPAQCYLTTLLAGHEPSQANVEVVGPHAADPSVTIGPQLLGGTQDHPVFGDVPPATQGDYVLGLTWDNETDRKVEFGCDFTDGFTFDLDGVDEIAFDVFVPGGGLLFPEGLIGIWDKIFGWNPSANLPTEFDKWSTITVDVSGRNDAGVSKIGALVFQNMGLEGDIAGTLFVDNLRLRRINPHWYGIIATGHDSRIDLRWSAVGAHTLRGYNIYRADSAHGPFTKLNDSPHTVTVYSSFLGDNNNTHYYYVNSVLEHAETAPSKIVSAAPFAMTDQQLITSVQEATFRYFWDFAHPVSALAREGYRHSRNTVTTGGTGFGLMAIVVGAERGFISRTQAAYKTLKILKFLDEKAARYHGAWSHWLNGATGETIPFGGPASKDNGGDLVETAFLIQGMLTARRYFDSDNPLESEIRSRVTKMWQEVEWDWYLRSPGSEVLYWHWSPNHAWAMNMPIVGYNECMIAYLLAIASPTHPIPPSCYYNGWARQASYTNSNFYYGRRQWVGPPYGGPLFWTHYSFLGFDPRNKSDDYCNYFDNSRNISLINRAHCINNPDKFAGYSALVWGLTASCNPWGYSAHSPTNDNGTIAPTAAISAMPYTPAESIATLKHLYHTYGDRLWGPFGFRDAFNLQENWFSDTYLAIDQGPIVVMIENYRTRLCWNLFMSNPEIHPMLQKIGWTISTHR